MFAFVEGALVTALREGHWILLDEINLAPAETLERIGGILESETGSMEVVANGGQRSDPCMSTISTLRCDEPRDRRREA